MALELSGTLPPLPSPGAAVIYAVSEEVGLAWVLSIGTARALAAKELSPCAFEANIRDVWQRAAVAVSRALPFAVQSIRHHSDGRAELCRLGLTPIASGSHGGRFTVPSVIGGDSFGLAFALALASCALDEAIPGDVAALAAVDAEGRTEAVDGLEAKCAVLAGVTTRVKRVFVHSTNAAQVRQLLPEHDVIEVGDVGQAISLVWPDYPATLARRAADPGERSRLIDSLWLLTLAGRQSYSKWHPVAETARLLMQLDVNGVQRAKLRVTEAIAKRNDGELVPLTLTADELMAFPEPARTATAAHLVQHAASKAFDPIAAKAIFERLSVRGTAAFPEHLKLLGAWGRLLESQGKLAEALAIQKEAADGWVARQGYEDLSYPLTKWLELSAELARVQDFNDARNCFDRHHRLNVFTPDGLTYLEGALAQARMRLSEQVPD